MKQYRAMKGAKSSPVQHVTPSRTALRENERVSIDYLPLIAPVTRDEVIRFKRESRERAKPWAGSTSAATVLTALIGVVVAVVFIGVFSTVIPGVYLSFASDGAAPSLVAPFLIVPLLVVAIFGLAAYRYFRHATDRWESLLRRTRFASANQLLYSPGTRNPDYPGLIFAHGDSRQTMDNYYSLTEPRLDLGNFRYTTGSGKEKKTHTWGYL